MEQCPLKAPCSTEDMYGRIKTWKLVLFNFNFTEVQSVFCTLMCDSVTAWSITGGYKILLKFKYSALQMEPACFVFRQGSSIQLNGKNSETRKSTWAQHLDHLRPQAFANNEFQSSTNKCDGKRNVIICWFKLYITWAVWDSLGWLTRPVHIL